MTLAPSIAHPRRLPPSDQASRLRELVSALRKPEHPRPSDSSPLLPDRSVPMITVTSGKGGVGKTSLAVNLAQALTARGQKVGLIDADPGTANADVLFGISPSRRLDRVARGDDLGELAVETNGGVLLLPGVVGALGVSASSHAARARLLSALGQLNEACDVLIVDTGAGIGSAVTEFVAAADHTIVVATPEPTSMIDAYALLKVVYSRSAAMTSSPPRCSLVVNQVHSRAEADAVIARLTAAAQRFLDVGIGSLGSIPWDRGVSRAVKAGTPLVLGAPRRSASRAIFGIADVISRGILRTQQMS